MSPTTQFVSEHKRPLCSSQYMLQARTICGWLFIHCVAWAEALARPRTGRSSAARMPMMAITTNSSSKVNAESASRSSVGNHTRFSFCCMRQSAIEPAWCSIPLGNDAPSPALPRCLGYVFAIRAEHRRRHVVVKRALPPIEDQPPFLVLLGCIRHMLIIGTEGRRLAEVLVLRTLPAIHHHSPFVVRVGCIGHVFAIRTEDRVTDVVAVIRALYAVHHHPPVSASLARIRHTFAVGAENRVVDVVAIRRSFLAINHHMPTHAPLARIRHSLRSEEHTSELQSLRHLVCRLL